MRNLISSCVFLFILFQSCGNSINKEEKGNDEPTAVVAGTSNSNPDVAQSEDVEQAKINFIREFYIQYITACDEMRNSSDLEEKSFTKELREKLDKGDYDYDPILNAQDCDKATLKTLHIVPINHTENVYNVSYDFGKDKVQIKISLTEKNGNYLISKVE